MSESQSPDEAAQTEPAPAAAPADANPQLASAVELIKILRALSFAADQRLAATAGISAILSMMPGVEALNPVAAGRIAAGMIPNRENSAGVRKLAAANALAVIRLARALRAPPQKAGEAAPASASPGNGQAPSAT
jgi:hypothetical protein